MYPKDYIARFSANLRYARKCRGLTQTELTQIMIANDEKKVKTDGLRVRLSKWENGESLPSIPECISLCNILDVEMDFLLGIVEKDL